MSEKKDGGPAFPGEINGEFGIQYWNGMTLRDYFAGQALSFIVVESGKPTAEYVASVAYKIADAMLAERDK